ncbi:MAG: hypothetical protein HYY94_04130, partial [Gemmatimonadetes bacterium]|nr:hypothetical protein [Gemmatimonadota bacterium]
AIRESKLERGLIWVGANDGPFHVTRDGGKTWTNVTPKHLPPDGRVQNIEPSPHQAGKAYFAAYRYLLGDDQPYIYRTTDYGKTWTRLTTGQNGMPADYPTRVVREDPAREGLLYAGTQYGAFISFDDGAHWQPFQQNLPRTPVTDIKVVGSDLAISTMGRSFWVMDDVQPLRELSQQVASQPRHLFQPRDAYRTRYGGGFGLGSRDPAEPEYLRPGAIIDYYFAQPPSGEVKLEILDNQNNVIRAFSSEGPGAPSQMQQGMRAPVMVQAGSPRLDQAAGMHRFIWDLAHPGAWDAEPQRAGSGGPLAVPGSYRVRLSAADWSETKSFRVLMDPRIAQDGVTLADLEGQLGLSLKVRDALSEARMALPRVRDGKKTQPQNSEGWRRLDAIETQLATASANGIRYPQPMLIDQLAYLHRMITQSDQKVGRDGFERYDELRKQLDGLLQQISAAVNGGR